MCHTAFRGSGVFYDAALRLRLIGSPHAFDRVGRLRKGRMNDCVRSLTFFRFCFFEEWQLCRRVRSKS